MRTEDLTGRLLVATPGLGEGVFERCVMLVLHHGDEGAQAVVLNKPVDATIDTVLDGWQEHVREPQVLFQGGPVQLDSALGVVGVHGRGRPLVHRRTNGTDRPGSGTGRSWWLLVAAATLAVIAVRLWASRHAEVPQLVADEAATTIKESATEVGLTPTTTA